SRRPPPLSTLFPYTTLFRSAATSLAISTAGTLVGTLRHATSGRVSLTLLVTVGLPSAVAAYFTARHAGLIDPRALKLAIALVLRSEEHTSELQSRENLVCRL